MNAVSFLSPKLHVGPRPHKGGTGVLASEPISEGELLAIWAGRIVDVDGLAAVPEDQRRYAVQVEEGLFLVHLGEPEEADFINHSCDPNAGLSGQVALIAMREIAVGEEICYDYAMSDGSPYDEFDCGCGTPHCRGRVTGTDWLRPELQERYAGYFSAYLQRRIAAAAAARV